MSCDDEWITLWRLEQWSGTHRDTWLKWALKTGCHVEWLPWYRRRTRRAVHVDDAPRLMVRVLSGVRSARRAATTADCSTAGAA